MKYLKVKIWAQNRVIANLQEDGTVVFVPDVTNEELQYAITNILIENEKDRQWAIQNKEKAMKALDELTAEAQEMGLYDNPPKML
jgi:shikimate 5-dehydrogenase